MTIHIYIIRRTNS